MAWPASQEYLVQTFTEANQTALRIKERTQDLRDRSAVGDLDRRFIFSHHQKLIEAINIFNTAKATPGIVQYAQDQFNDPTLDVTAEYTAMLDAATSMATWVVNNFPTDATTDALLMQKFGVGGVAEPLVFTTAQLAGWRTEADALIATIN